MKNYHAFQEKVDSSFNDISSFHQGHMKCQKGCHQCCRPDITVTYVEKQAIQDFLSTHPERAKKVEETRRLNPHRGQRCEFLNKDGACDIYEMRPIVCRSHGAPLQFKNPENENQLFRDVCPLNLKDIKLENLPPQQLLNLDSINAILSVINMHYNSERSNERFPLTLDGIIND